MGNGLKFNESTLEYVDLDNERTQKDGSKYTMKTIIGNFLAKEILRLQLNNKEFIVYRHTYKVSKNMYMDIFMATNNGIEKALAVVTHMEKPWEVAEKLMGNRKPYVGYSQNAYDIVMADTCLQDTMQSSKAEEVLGGNGVSTLLRLSSREPGLGKLLLMAVSLSTLKFRTHPKRLWIDPVGYELDGIDDYLNIVVETSGRDEKLDNYYTQLGFSWFKSNEHKELKDSRVLSYSIMHLGYQTLKDPSLVAWLRNTLKGHLIKTKATSINKHLDIKQRRMIVNIINNQ